MIGVSEYVYKLVYEKLQSCYLFVVASLKMISE